MHTVLKNFHIKLNKTRPSLIFSQPQVPPSKEFSKKNQGPPPPGFPTTVHLCIEVLFSVSIPKKLQIFVIYNKLVGVPVPCMYPSMKPVLPPGISVFIVTFEPKQMEIIISILKSWYQLNLNEAFFNLSQCLLMLNNLAVLANSLYIWVRNVWHQNSKFYDGSIFF